MRYRIELEVHSPYFEGDFTSGGLCIDIRYHSIFLSLLKRGLKAASPKQYDNLYETKNLEKVFAQALIFHGAEFHKEKIILKTPKISWLWSSPQADLAMAFYNAFAYLKQLESVSFHNDAKICVKSITMIYQEPISEKSVDFQLVSPLIVRDHNQKTRKDWFLSFSDENFESVLKQNLKSKCVLYLGSGAAYDIDNLIFEPLQMRKSVTKIYEKSCQGSLGTFRLIGEPYLLNFIRDAGLGSRTGMFCGYLDQIFAGR